MDQAVYLTQSLQQVAVAAVVVPQEPSLVLPVVPVVAVLFLSAAAPVIHQALAQVKETPVALVALTVAVAAAAPVQ
jgi:hypothetical protein